MKKKLLILGAAASVIALAGYALYRSISEPDDLDLFKEDDAFFEDEEQEGMDTEDIE